MWEYKFVPFTGVIATSGASRQQLVEQAATTFAALVRQHTTSDGWEYYRLESFPVVVPAGCLPGLFGAPTTVEQFGVAVFRRSSPR